MRIYLTHSRQTYGVKRFRGIGAQVNMGNFGLSDAELNAIGAALEDANTAAEKTIASLDRLHITMQDCHRELRLARQIIEQSNQAARLTQSEARETSA